jgi:regulator of protease activity HflC (stomatin/prohibitin superfamily)
MGLFIAFIVLGVISVILLISASSITRAARKPESDWTMGEATGFWVATAIFSFIALLLLILSSLTKIGTQDIGVKTAFGKTVGSGLKPGLHWKAPWESVHRLDFKTQTDTYASNGFNGSTQNNAQGGCIVVRIARQATACVNVSVRWQNVQSGVDFLFKNYKTDDNIRNNLLHRDLQSAVNVAFAHYDPLGLNPKTGDSTQPTNVQLGATIQQALQSSPQVADNLAIYSVLVPIFSFDPATQDRLNQLQLQVAQTRIAQQSEQTATAQAAANRALAKSVINNPGVLQSKCLDTLADAVKANYALPAGFSCFGGSSAVVVPGNTAK